jgi:hypothetical protein
MKIERELMNFLGRLIEVESRTMIVPVRILKEAAIEGLDEYHLPAEMQDLERAVRLDRQFRSNRVRK